MADETVRIKVLAETKQAYQSLKDFGEKLSGIGQRITGAFTVPIAGAFALAVSQSKELQAALEPIKKEFQGVAAELGRALIPIVKELTPAILEFARALTDIIRQFEALDPGTKKAILGLVAFVAAVGPVLVAVGQLIATIGMIGEVVTTVQGAMLAAQTGAMGFGASMVAALAPILPLLIAIAGLIALINSEFGKSGIKAGAQLLTMGVAGGAALFGGAEAGKKAFYDTGNALGAFQPSPAPAMAGGQTVIYNNFGVDTSNVYAKNAVGKLTNQQLRDNRQR